MLFLSFLGKNLGAIIGFILGALLAWQVATSLHECPPITKCPPQNITVYHIQNDKIKIKNGGTIDIDQIIKDNKNTTTIPKDSIPVRKKKSFWDLFRRKPKAPT